MKQAIANKLEIYAGDIKRKLRDEKIRYRGLRHLDEVC